MQTVQAPNLVPRVGAQSLEQAYVQAAPALAAQTRVARTPRAKPRHYPVIDLFYQRRAAGAKIESR